MVIIDRSQPEGNVFNLIGVAMKEAKRLNKVREGNYLDPEEIKKDMMSGDYNHACDVITNTFENIILL